MPPAESDGLGAIIEIRLPRSSYVYAVSRFVSASAVPSPPQPRQSGSGGVVVPEIVQFRISEVRRPLAS